MPYNYQAPYQGGPQYGNGFPDGGNAQSMDMYMYGNNGQSAQMHFPAQAQQRQPMVVVPQQPGPNMPNFTSTSSHQQQAYVGQHVQQSGYSRASPAGYNQPQYSQSQYSPQLQVAAQQYGHNPQHQTHSQIGYQQSNQSSYNPVTSQAAFHQSVGNQPASPAQLQYQRPLSQPIQAPRAGSPPQQQYQQPFSQHYQAPQAQILVQHQSPVVPQAQRSVQQRQSRQQPPSHAHVEQQSPLVSASSQYPHRQESYPPLSEGQAYMQSQSPVVLPTHFEQQRQAGHPRPPQAQFVIERQSNAAPALQRQQYGQTSYSQPPPAQVVIQRHSPVLTPMQQPQQRQASQSKPSSRTPQSGPVQRNKPVPQQKMKQDLHRVPPPQQQQQNEIVPQQSQQSVVEPVSNPVQRPIPQFASSDMGHPTKRRRSNEGISIPVPTVDPVHTLLNPSFTSSPLTELTSSQMPSTPQPDVDSQGVLLTLADEYISAAYTWSASLDLNEDPGDALASYHRLVSTGMGCLEAVLKNFRRMDARQEARIRLRLATLLVEETENDEEAEEVLSKGLALCERSRLQDLKYAMHHLLIRLTAKSKPKAAMKAIDKIVQDVEALSLRHWVYAFRFLGVCIAMRTGSSSSAYVLKHVTTISSLASQARNVAAQITASAFEAMVYVASGSSDAIELAQRALATARSHQLMSEMEGMPQVKALLDCLDLSCSLIQNNLEQIGVKLEQLQQKMDASSKDRSWTMDGSFQIDVTCGSNKDIEQDTAGIMTSSGDGRTFLVLRWLSKAELFGLGYIFSGLGVMQKNHSNSQAETYLQEGLKLCKSASGTYPRSLAASTASAERWSAFTIYSRMTLIALLCDRGDWLAAREAIDDVKQSLQEQVHTKQSVIEKWLCYLEATCEQATGNLQLASKLYSSPMLEFDPTSKCPSGEKDLQALATLNLVLIVRTQSLSAAETMLSRVESYCLSHANKALQAACYTVKATMRNDPDLSVIKIKQYLQAAVQAATAVSSQPLLCVIMNTMTDMFFHNIVGEQAEKSARAGRSLATKTKNKLWTTVADGMFADIKERCGKEDEAAAARLEAQTLMAELPEQLVRQLETV